MLKKSIYIILMIFGFVASAQIPLSNLPKNIAVFPKERVELFINSQVLLAGELLQYKAYSLNSDGNTSDLSKIMYVSMRDEKDSIVFKHKLKIENGIANGDFFIPSTLKSSVYRLIGYTNFTRNNVTDAYFEKNIYVINSFVKPLKATHKDTDSSHIHFKLGTIPTKSINTEGNILSIHTDKTSYGYREMVTLNIENLANTANGNYVLSVRKVSPLEISQLSKATTIDKSAETYYIPEIRGEIISGVVYSIENDSPVMNKEVSLTIPGNDYVFKLAKTNEEGRFFFSVAEGYSTENSIIQINESQGNASKFKLVLDDKELKIDGSNLPKIKLDPSVKDWLQERSVQLQIENAYFDVKKDSIFSVETSTPFFDNLGTVYQLDDYTRFPSVRETFVEVVTLAAIRGSGANARFIVNNEYDPNGTAKFNDLDPLVLMDGVQILNNDDLINFNVKDIESIRVINKPYRYGPKIFSGIIAIETKKGDFVPSNTGYTSREFNFPSIVKGKQYYTPNYQKGTALSRIPDYRVQLLWNPSLELNKSAVSYSFFTSDVGGLYEIVVVGFSVDGNNIASKNYFTVSEK